MKIISLSDPKSWVRKLILRSFKDIIVNSAVFVLKTLRLWEMQFEVKQWIDLLFRSHSVQWWFGERSKLTWLEQVVKWIKDNGVDGGKIILISAITLIIREKQCFHWKQFSSVLSSVFFSFNQVEISCLSQLFLIYLVLF